LIDPGTSTLRQIKGFRCATGRWVHPRIGMLRALNRNVEREFDSARKDTHWRRRKPARDPIEPRKKLIAGVFALPSPGALKAEPTSA
jgi:hypothetical protein